MAAEEIGGQGYDGPPQQREQNTLIKEGDFDERALELLAKLITDDTTALDLQQTGTVKRTVVGRYPIIYHDNGN